jgi:hypothetical protein
MAVDKLDLVYSGRRQDERREQDQTDIRGSPWTVRAMTGQDSVEASAGYESAAGCREDQCHHETSRTLNTKFVDK